MSLLASITFKFYHLLYNFTRLNMNLTLYFWKNIGRETKKTKKQYTEAKTKKI